MNFQDLIEKKKHGKAHTKDEIEYIINSVYDDSMSDAEISAWLMAVYFKGLNINETVDLTNAIAFSGKVADVSEIKNGIVDKHSTGGVGDKVSIALIPLLASAGIPIAKLSDTGVSLNSGTIDKLESISGFKANYSEISIINQIKNIKAVISSSADEFAPVDKKLYSLRCMTSTADSKELIAASILAKEIASGVETILVDVKYGSGALMKTTDDAIELAHIISKTAERLDKTTIVAITSMEEPLGRTIGNSLEVIEAIEFLKGNIKDGDFAYLTYYLAGLILVKKGLYDDINQAEDYLKELVNSGCALEKFKELVSAQGGDILVVDSYDNFELPSFKIECLSKKNGYLHSINAKEIGKAAKALGAVKRKTTDKIDHSVGIYLNKKSGDYIQKDELLYTIYSNDEEATRLAQHYCDNAFSIDNSKPSNKNIVYKVIGIEEENV